MSALILSACAHRTTLGLAPESSVGVRGDDRYFNIQTRSFERPPPYGPRAGQNAQR